MGKSDDLRAFDFIFLLKLFFIVLDILVFYNFLFGFRIRFDVVVLWLHIFTNLLVFLKLDHEINQVFVAVQKEVEF